MLQAMGVEALHDDSPAIELAHRDFPLLSPLETVEQALAKFRRSGLGHKIVYVYVADDFGHLLGVLPVRKLLTSEPGMLIGNIFIASAVSLPATVTVGQAREAFSRHRFLAFPMVDERNRIQGVIDIERFAGNLGDIGTRTRFDDIYELLGMRDMDRALGSPLSAFRMRFPWLGSTLLAGLCSALLTSLFETTLKQALILAFFLTLVLGLNESVAMQSATLAVQKLHRSRPGWRELFAALRTEVATAALLGLACGVAVCAVAWLWRGDAHGAVSIGASLCLSIIASCCWGVAVPYVLHHFMRDPKLAAGPIALGLSDVTTLVLYFVVARAVLG